ncbi:MAG: helix-turn-helix domain-containing protein [Bdellovibrionota bacterium]
MYQTLRIGEKIIRLSPMENKLLYFLSIQPETCAKRPPIILYLWPEVRSSRKKDNHLDVCISRLRKKIDEEVGKKPLVTHEKHHYRFIYPLILDR